MRRVLFLLAPLLVVACDRQPVAPAFEAGPHNTASSWMNNPDNGNPRITRFGESFFAASWTDPDNGLRVTHTNFPIGDEPDCGPQELLDPVDRQDVGLLVDPFFESQIRTNLRGPVWIIVRDVTQAGDCYGVRLVAEGMGEAAYNDNDRFFVGPEGQNANTWGYRGSGVLTTPAGEEVTYHGESHFTYTNNAELRAEEYLVSLR